jgi:hypothetical protein
VNSYGGPTSRRHQATQELRGVASAALRHITKRREVRIYWCMPLYTPAQSDIPVESTPLTEEAVERDRKNQAGSTATKVVYILVAIVLFALIIMTVVGPHIPAGE